MLTRHVWPQTDTTGGNPVGNFDKLVSHIDWHVTGIDNPHGMGKSVKLNLGFDIDEPSDETIKNRRQKKMKFLVYWLKKTFRYLQRKILVLQTHTDILDVIINVSRLSDQFTMRDDCDVIATTAAKCMKSNIKNHCNILPPLKWSPTMQS